MFERFSLYLFVILYSQKNTYIYLWICNLSYLYAVFYLLEGRLLFIYSLHLGSFSVLDIQTKTKKQNDLTTLICFFQDLVDNLKFCFFNFSGPDIFWAIFLVSLRTLFINLVMYVFWMYSYMCVCILIKIVLMYLFKWSINSKQTLLLQSGFQMCCYISLC